MKKIAVIAGTAKEAKEWIKKNRVRGNKYFAISDNNYDGLSVNQIVILQSTGKKAGRWTIVNELFLAMICINDEQERRTDMVPNVP